MALLNFNYGLVNDVLAQDVKNGNLYIATDSQGLYVDLEGKRIHVSDFIQVATMDELNALGIYNTHTFYYVAGSNALLKYTGVSGAEWKQLNSTADLTAALNALAGRVTQNETDISALKTADAALDAKIDALNAGDIETTQEITVTTAVGNYAKGSKISADTDLQTLILNMLCADSDPSTTKPGLSSVSLTGAGAKEVGTTFDPSYTINVTTGEYKANGVTQATGVTYSAYSATEKGRPDGATAETKSTKSGTFNSFTVTDGMNYYISATATHGDGNIPKTYLGKDYPSGQIKGATVGPKSSSAVTGYRPIFYGMSTATTAIGNMTSADVRGLTKINEAPAARTVTFTAANLAGVKRFIIAIPTDSGLGVTKATITSSMNADATNSYNKIGTVNVEGANNYKTTKSYDIWVYQPASIASVEVHDVTIG